LNRKLKILIVAAGIIFLPVLLAPMPRFKTPFSTVVEARDGSLLGARIADDGQWRFPPPAAIPRKFEKAALTFEDRYYYYHPGINLLSAIRAFYQNIKAGRIVSGGSTITMQVARLSRGNRRRTYPGKIIEMLSALKLELFRSKKEIFKMYATNAPFGSNIVGIEAAAWRYSGKSSEDITWAEAAALAVLPNSPALVYPGRNQEVLRVKRDRLLKRLYERGLIDSITFVLSTDEPLPGASKPLPAKAPHLTDMFWLTSRGQRIRTTIDPGLQERASGIVNSHQEALSGNMIFNAAAIIISVKKGEVLAYVGNSSNESSSGHGGEVDIIRSLRSTGSILKPFLYAAMQESGDILPNSLIPDIPTRFPGFTPENFSETYSGAVPAAAALSQSLNIPAVRMLEKYTPKKFIELLKKTGFTTFSRPAGHYGLSIILGGGETSLWELTGAYSSVSRALNRFNREGRYFKGDYHPPVLVTENELPADTATDTDPPFSAASIWLTYEALQKVNRPETETGWQYFSSASGLAWKTGTSFGFRDAWAVGTTPGYVIGVWAGNASGEGRPGLTGISAAAPILFDLEGIMTHTEWFKPPYQELTTIKVCRESGFRAGSDCPETVDIPACLGGLKSDVCPFHRTVHLNNTLTKQVTADCYPASEIKNEKWFVLPPAMEYFYRHKHPEYNILPPYSPGCMNGRTVPVMEFIYPVGGMRIFIPRDHTGEYTRIVAEVVHRNPGKRIFWHLDEDFISTTRFIHQVEILASRGSHRLTVVDEDGNSSECRFSIIGGTAEPN
jgi:penicillin-binding protein 1C